MRHKSPSGTYSFVPHFTQTLQRPLNPSPVCTLDFIKTSFTKNLFIYLCDLLSQSHLMQLSFEGEVYHYYYYYSCIPVLQNGAFFFSTDMIPDNSVCALSHIHRKSSPDDDGDDDAEQEEEVGYLYRFIVFTVPGGGGGAEHRHRFLRWFGYKRAIDGGKQAREK